MLLAKQVVLLVKQANVTFLVLVVIGGAFLSTTSVRLWCYFFCVCLASAP